MEATLALSLSLFYFEALESMPRWTVSKAEVRPMGIASAGSSSSGPPWLAKRDGKLTSSKDSICRLVKRTPFLVLFASCESACDFQLRVRRQSARCDSI